MISLGPLMLFISKRLIVGEDPVFLGGRNINLLILLKLSLYFKLSFFLHWNQNVWRQTVSIMLSQLESLVLYFAAAIFHQPTWFWWNNNEALWERRLTFIRLLCKQSCYKCTRYSTWNSHSNCAVWFFLIYCIFYFIWKL